MSAALSGLDGDEAAASEVSGGGDMNDESGASGGGDASGVSGAVGASEVPLEAELNDELENILKDAAGGDTSVDLE